MSAAWRSPPARWSRADLQIPVGAQPGRVAADGACAARAFRAAIETLGVAPDSPRHPRTSDALRKRRFVPGRGVVERTPAHLGAGRGIRTRGRRKLDGCAAFPAAASHDIRHDIRQTMGL